jgi:hypothetical protein
MNRAFVAWNTVIRRLNRQSQIVEGWYIKINWGGRLTIFHVKIVNLPVVGLDKLNLKLLLYFDEGHRTNILEKTPVFSMKLKERKLTGTFS